MHNQPENRRTFVKGMALALSALGSQPNALLAAVTPPISFFIAGTRFHPLREALMAGEPVTLVESSFRGEACFAIYSRQGERAGYVPRRFISIVRESGITTGRILSSEPYRVSWERYLVGLDPV